MIPTTKWVMWLKNPENSLANTNLKKSGDTSKSSSIIIAYLAS